MILNAYAKINWALAIRGRRADGYHLLDMLMQTISLHDTLHIAPAQSLTLDVEGDCEICAEDNLVMRAARLLREAAGCEIGASMRLVKRIPTGAGLGGGSADAAAALRGLARLWNIPAEEEDMKRLALRLGADVPFFLEGGLARVQGIGEIIEAIEPAPGPFHLVVIQPGRHLSTPEVYALYDRLDPPPMPSTERVLAALKAHQLDMLASELGNALETAAVTLCPQIADCMNALHSQGALRCMVTGSGSAVIGLFIGELQAARAAAACVPFWPKCYAVQTLLKENMGFLL